ncbi:MAG: hypothetical protein CMJ48_10475 [Planctomycetaceae bacterium]|nr:hypothetical protein [Planctomycetaceae bacterium]
MCGAGWLQKRLWFIPCLFKGLGVDGKKQGPHFDVVIVQQFESRAQKNTVGAKGPAVFEVVGLCRPV